MVQRASLDSQSKSNGVSDVASPYLGSMPEHSMAFDIRDVTDIAVPNVSPAEVSVKEANGMYQHLHLTYCFLTISPS